MLDMLLTGAVPLFAEAASGTCNPQQLAELALASSEAVQLMHRLLRDQGSAVNVLENPSRARMIA